ncbi:cytosolic endo-beta-N-acetylglucosaminidase isoform X2 [Rhipicephalus sanguineus]|uniref:cytosolic endo-beta-N-acetylglucosaminidase isoform X2 n=1 Tax=Rhipicephalus sanguineus TaxID=34632 RepID=UPI0020C3259B|nr:cytosolic endo-beta-N-acetylglucosaminidase isoform X2 [Rhipicephalus sanguineus]
MVTIPPPGWITAAHKHGVKVLGTFTLKSEEGAKAINKIKGAGLVANVASQLARVAALHRFDGWLVRIATSMDHSAGYFVVDLLAAMTEEMHRAVPGSTVIWQESVQPNGKVEPQSELNDKNLAFLNSCDGIVLNSKWNENLLHKSAATAGKRRGNVYAGIDVLARDTCYEGRYDMHKAVATARRYGLSAAISGAGWVYDEDHILHAERSHWRYFTYGQDKTVNFRANQCLLWALPEECRPQWRVTKLPLSTTFCQGFGTSVYKEGRAVKPASWFNLSEQELQPRDQGSKLCGGGGTAMLDTSVSYNGGGCLRLEYDPRQAPGSKVIPYFRKYLVKDATGSANLEEIGISFNSNESIGFFIGELVVKRPEVPAGSIAARDPDTQTPSDEDGAGRPETEARLREWLTKKDEITGQQDQAEEAPVAFDVSMSSDEGD